MERGSPVGLPGVVALTKEKRNKRMDSAIAEVADLCIVLWFYPNNYPLS